MELWGTGGGFLRGQWEGCNEAEAPGDSSPFQIGWGNEAELCGWNGEPSPSERELRVE